MHDKLVKKTWILGNNFYFIIKTIQKHNVIQIYIYSEYQFR